MVIMDHHCWDFEGLNYGVSETHVISDHFTTPLAFHKYNSQAAIFEFRQLKKLVKSKHRHMQHSSSLWEVIFQQHSESFPNILLIMELILSISYSSSKRKAWF